MSVLLSAQSNEDSIAFSIDLEDFVVTGNFEPVHYKKAIHKVQVIDKQNLSNRGVLNLGEALNTISTIRLSNDAALGTSVSLRGIGASNVAILIDGIPVIGREGGMIDLSQISLQNVERLEIVEGPLSNLYGSNAAGGVVNIITSKSQINKWKIQSNNQIESLGINNHDMFVGYQVSPRWLVGVKGRYFRSKQFDTDSFRVYVPRLLSDSSITMVKKYPFNPKVQYGFGGHTRYSFNEEDYLMVKYDYNFEEVSSYDQVRRPIFKPYSNDEFFTTFRSDWAASYKNVLDKNQSFQIDLARNLYRRRKDAKRYYHEDKSYDSALTESDTTSFINWFAKGVHSYKLNNSWTLISGFNLNKEIGSGDKIIQRGKEDSTTVDFSEIAIFSDVRYRFNNKIESSISLRFFNHNLYGSRLTPSIQTNYQINSQWNIRAGLSQGYRSPTLKELFLEFIDVNHHVLGNQDLKPEYSYDAQATLLYEPNKSHLFQLGSHYTIIDDRINLVNLEENMFIYRNDDKFSVFGLNPTYVFDSKCLTFRSDISLRWRNEKVVEDQPTYEIFSWDVNSQVNIKTPIRNLSLLINHRYVGAEPRYRIIDEAVIKYTQEDYHRIDLSLTYKMWSDKLLWSIGCKNLLNNKRLNLSSPDTAHASSSFTNSQGISWFGRLSISI